MPLRLPVGTVTPSITDEMLACGFRRSGQFVYRTECPNCDECKPTRVEVDRFKMTPSMRRVFNRGSRDLICRWGPPAVDFDRIELFNRHRSERRLGAESDLVDEQSYVAFLAESCCNSRELAIFHGDELVAIAIVDVGAQSISAVYTFFNPDAGRFSLGTFAILKQIDWARESGRRFVYLGMYVAANSHLNYKARFVPQQRLDEGVWTDHGNPT